MAATSLSFMIPTTRQAGVLGCNPLTLSQKLTAAARALLAETYPLIVTGRAPRTPQDDNAATKFGRRRPADGLIDWSRSSWRIYNLVRAVTRPFPGAFTYLKGKRIFIWAARATDQRVADAPPGSVLGIGDSGTLEVATGNGVLEVLQIQPEGGEETDGRTFFARILGGSSKLRKFESAPE